MKIFKMNDMTRGWVVGDFEPSILRTKEFEVGYLIHRKGEYWASHIHKIATEINCLIRGQMTICGKKIYPGDIFVIKPEEIADPIFLEDCEILVIKIPSAAGDKYNIEKE